MEITTLRADLINSHNLVEMYLKQLDRKTTTKESYKKSLNVFIKWLELERKSEVNKESLVEYKSHISKKNTPNTVNAYLVAIKGFYSFLEENNISKDIAKSIKSMKAPKRFSKAPLTVKQAVRLLNSFDRGTLSGSRDYALINLMISTGVRVSEVHHANVEDIDQTSGQAILYIQGKGRDSKDDYVILDCLVLESLEDYFRARGNRKGALFQGIGNRANERLAKGSISRIVKNSFRSIGLDNPKLTAHSTRHTAVTFSLLGGATIQEAQAMARHSNINTTMIYSHNINRNKNNAESRIAELLKGGALHG